MLWRKEAGMKFTDLCIFIDENVPKIVNPGEFPDLENKVYNYLWLLIKALAIKRRMFSNFSDYDPFAFYGATRVFFALRKNIWNQGKTIKGKEIKPIKSCLNYIKSIMHPMKLEYQKEAFAEVMSEEFTSKKFDAFKMRENLKAQAQADHGVPETFKKYVLDALKDSDVILEKVLEKSPFTKDSSDYYRLKITILLNCYEMLKKHKKLNGTPDTLIMWKLPKHLSGYVKVLMSEFFTELKKEIMDCYSISAIDDETLEYLISNPGYDSGVHNEE